MMRAMHKRKQVRTTITLGSDMADELKRLALTKDSDLSKLIRRALRFWLGAGCPEEPAPARPAE